ncbi:hypothetical protein [Saccharibacillus sacchari]|uniref:Uncharacterized protein n=1 Tax=Saccharibacillus sacchari TaxID=456493 RepID=A0ACC6PKI9_9BACL
MYNLLLINVKCPRCNESVNAEAEFKIGLMNLDTYKLGDELKWAIGRAKSPHQLRPQNGDSIGEGYVCCPNCEKDFWVVIKIEHDIISSFEVDITKKGYIE